MLSLTEDFGFRIHDFLPVPPLNLVDLYCNVAARAGG